MATNAFNPVHHHCSLRRRHSIDCPPIATATSFSLKSSAAAACRQSLSHSATLVVSSVAASASTSTSDAAAAASLGTVSFDLLQLHLSSKDFRQADEETRRLLIVLAGEAAQKRGYVFFSEVQFISADDLKTIDELWLEYTDGRFGYSVQKRIWEKVNEDFTKFFIKVGWMKKLEGSEVEQYNYRSFPAEFMWEGTPPAPEGHLPLTNALRGTQLLISILIHPAFDSEKEESEKDDITSTATSTAEEAKGKDKKGIDLKGSKGFKLNYTF